MQLIKSFPEDSAFKSVFLNFEQRQKVELPVFVNIVGVSIKPYRHKQDYEIEPTGWFVELTYLDVPTEHSVEYDILFFKEGEVISPVLNAIMDEYAMEQRSCHVFHIGTFELPNPDLDNQRGHYLLVVPY